MPSMTIWQVHPVLCVWRDLNVSERGSRMHLVKAEGNRRSELKVAANLFSDSACVAAVKPG